MQGKPHSPRVTYVEASEAVAGGLNDLGWGLYSRLVRYLAGLAAAAVLIPIGILVLLFGVALIAEFARWLAIQVGASGIATWIDQLGSAIADPDRFWTELLWKSSLYGTVLLALLGLWPTFWPDRNKGSHVHIEPYVCAVSQIRTKIEIYRRAFCRGMRSSGAWAWANLFPGVALGYVAARTLADGTPTDLRSEIGVAPGALAELALHFVSPEVSLWYVVAAALCVSIAFLLNAARLFRNAPIGFFVGATLNPMWGLLMLYAALFGTVALGVGAYRLASVVHVEHAPLLIVATERFDAFMLSLDDNMQKCVLLILGLAFTVFGFGVFCLTYVFVGALAERLWAFSKNSLMANVRATMRSDPRAPVLFLRSFQDEDAAVSSAGLDGKIKINRIESKLAEEVRRCYGPFIAIAKPGDVKADGAARAFFKGEAWRDAVSAWMDQARLIVMLVGRTDGLKWELNEALARGYKGKIIFLFPPDHSHADARWEWARLVIRRHVSVASVSVADPRKALAAHFTPDNGIVMINGHKNDLEEVAAALHLGVFGLLVRNYEGAIGAPA